MLAENLSFYANVLLKINWILNQNPFWIMFCFVLAPIPFSETLHCHLLLLNKKMVKNSDLQKKILSQLAANQITSNIGVNLWM